MKYKWIVGVIAAVGILSFLILSALGIISINFGGWLFSSKYYESPLEAYNSMTGSTDIPAKKEIGFYQLDDEIGLFLGDVPAETEEHNLIHLGNELYYVKHVVVAEMSIKDSRYSLTGFSYTFVSFDNSYEKYLEVGCNQTETRHGTVKWNVFLTENEIKKLDNVEHVKKFHSEEIDSDFYLVVFKQ